MAKTIGPAMAPVTGEIPEQLKMPKAIVIRRKTSVLNLCMCTPAQESNLAFGLFRFW